MKATSLGSTYDPHKEVAGRGEVFVCAACGRRSRDRNGGRRIDAHWDESCRRHAVLCYESSVVLSNGLVISASAVQRN